MVVVRDNKSDEHSNGNDDTVDSHNSITMVVVVIMTIVFINKC